MSLLKALSTASLATYKNLSSATAESAHPITLTPWATRQELFNVLSYAAVFFVIISHYRTQT